MIYILLFIYFCYPLIRRYKKGSHQLFYKLQCVTLILLMGFRNYVGGDTIGYMTRYEWVSPINQLTVTDLALSKFQPFWMLFQGLCKIVSDDFYVLQLFLSAFVNVSVFMVARKYSVNEFWAVFVYLLTCMLNYNCEILRASIAICFFFIAYEQLLLRHYVRYYLLILVAILFHDQSVLLLPLPLLMPLVKKPLSPVLMLLLLFTGIILSLPQVMRLYVQYLPGDRSEEFSEGYGSMKVATFLGFIRGLLNLFTAYVFSRMQFVREDKYLFPAFNIYFACLLLSVGMPIFGTRVSQFFQIYYLIILSSFIYIYKKTFLKMIIVVLWVFGVVRYYTRDITSWVDTNPNAKNRYYSYDRYYPYYSIWEDINQDILSKRKEIGEAGVTK